VPVNVRSKAHAHKYDGTSNVSYTPVTTYEYSWATCPLGHSECTFNKVTRTSYFWSQSIVEKLATFIAVGIDIRSRVHSHSYEKVSAVLDVDYWVVKVGVMRCDWYHYDCRLYAYTSFPQILPTSSLTVSPVIESPPHKLSTNIRDKRHIHSLNSIFFFVTAYAYDHVFGTCPAGHDNCQMVSQTSIAVTTWVTTPSTNTKTIEW